LQHLEESLVREGFTHVIVGAIRARSLLVIVTAVAGDIEQRLPRKAFVNPPEHPATVAFRDFLVV
jgi:hypothetical protein